MFSGFRVLCRAEQIEKAIALRRNLGGKGKGNKEFVRIKLRTGATLSRWVIDADLSLPSVFGSSDAPLAPIWQTSEKPEYT